MPWWTKLESSTSPVAGEYQCLCQMQVIPKWRRRGTKKKLLEEVKEVKKLTNYYSNL